MKPAPDAMPEGSFGPYEVFERLGMGGMAMVHRAKKRGIEGFERSVALKRMLQHLAADANFVESFIREAKVASLLQHPNVAQVYDFGRISGVYYIAMELVTGFDIRKLLRYASKTGEPIPMAVILSILGELCDALEYAHTFVDEHGQHLRIVHRDISPSNLIVAHTGHLKVIDFGIAKANSRQLQTESGQVKGKLGYMSPEAAFGMPLDPVSDIFSMGVVAWELVTASPLFSARTDYETMRRIREADITPPSYHNRACPAELDSIIISALDRESTRRLPSAAVFRAAIDALATQHGIHHSARVVAEWITRFAQPGDAWVRHSQVPPAGKKAAPEQHTAVLRPKSPSSSGGMAPPQKLQLSPEQQKLATEIWGDDQQPVVAGPDFSIATGRPPTQPPPFSEQLPLLPPRLTPHPPPHHHQTGANQAPPMTVSQQLMQVPLYTPTGHPQLPTHPTQPELAQPSSKKPVLILGVLVVVALVLGGVLLLKKLKSAPDEPATVAAKDKKLRFVIEPPDSIIEIAGKEVSRESPFETELDPGIYTVTVRKPGFKPVETTITVRAGESQTFNLALNPGVAHVSIDSDPRGLPIDVDGKRTSYSTPAKMDIAAGKHEIKVTSANGEVWSETLDAAVDGNHSLTAMMKVADATPPKDKDATPKDKDKKPKQVAANDKDKKPKLPEVVEPPPPARPTPPDAAVVVQPKQPDPPPPPPDKPPVKPLETRTPVVAANAVTKLAGEIPTIKSAGGESNSDALVKMCIDANGKVTSVKVVKSSPTIATELQAALMKWRYKPYLNKDKEAQPVCFPVSLRLVFKRAD